MEEKQLVVGFVRGSHGVTGECRVESASGDYEHLLKLKEVTLRHFDETRTCKVESTGGGSQTVYIKFAGIDSPEEIKKFNGWEILVPRKYAHPLKKDEWYIEDLKTCDLVYQGDGKVSAESAAPAVVGTITDVLEGGAGYLLEVSLSESCDLLANEVKFTAEGKTRKVLVPFVNEHVGKVDIKNKTVQLMHLWILE
ncbi:MAG: ribosome maturation factor RimM [Treponema sp.]|nr:ribosome maturation factor RimM [Treponema sp.]